MWFNCHYSVCFRIGNKSNYCHGKMHRQIDQRMMAFIREYGMNGLNYHRRIISEPSANNIQQFNASLPSAAYMRRWTAQHWFRLWLVACLVPSHDLNQYWLFIFLAFGNKLQWSLNRNANHFVHEMYLKMPPENSSRIVSAPMCKCMKILITYLVQSCCYLDPGRVEQTYNS